SGADSITRSGHVRSVSTSGRYGVYLRWSNERRSSSHDDRVSSAGVPFVLLSCVALISSLLLGWRRRVHGPPMIAPIWALYASRRASRVLFCPPYTQMEQPTANHRSICA